MTLRWWLVALVLAVPLLATPMAAANPLPECQGPPDVACNYRGETCVVYIMYLDISMPQGNRIVCQENWYS